MSKQHRARILIINASLAAEGGNTAVALGRISQWLVSGGKAEVREMTLAVGRGEDGRGPMTKGFEGMKTDLAWAEAFVFGTGTHWDSWSSVLQKFLEDATVTEGTRLWLGKPAACVVTEHSVGGKGVLSRLQGVLVTLGCLIPPMSGVVLSKVAQMAGVHSLALVATGEARDFWCADDLKIVAHNLVEAVKGTRTWKAWRVDREEFSTRWME